MNKINFFFIENAYDLASIKNIKGFQRMKLTD